MNAAPVCISQALPGTSRFRPRRLCSSSCLLQPLWAVMVPLRVDDLDTHLDALDGHQNCTGDLGGGALNWGLSDAFVVITLGLPLGDRRSTGCGCYSLPSCRGQGLCCQGDSGTTTWMMTLTPWPRQCLCILPLSHCTLGSR